MNNYNDGATPEVESRDDSCGGRKGRKHYWQWLWKGAIWTNHVKCGSCGQIQERDAQGKVLPGTGTTAAQQ